MSLSPLHNVMKSLLISLLLVSLIDSFLVDGKTNAVVFVPELAGMLAMQLAI